MRSARPPISALPYARTHDALCLFGRYSQTPAGIKTKAESNKKEAKKIKDKANEENK